MRILIIEDEEDTVKALVRGLKREGYAVDAACDGLAGWELLDVNQYDILILDLNLPGLDGLEICRRIKSAGLDVLILMLTARSDASQKIAGLDAGADDYLAKPFHFGELCARLRVLLRRKLEKRNVVLEHQALRLDPQKKLVWKGQQPVPLTGKEFSILEYFLRRPGEIITQEQLLEHIWDINANPLSSTVRVHINSLRRKIGDSLESNSYIETVAGMGYRLAGPD